MVSCGGPNQQKIPAEKVEANQEVQEEEYVDPLFEIEGQLCQHVRCIFEDSYGNLWFGTNVYDLMLYNGDSLVYLDEEQNSLKVSPGYKTPDVLLAEMKAVASGS